MQLGGGEIREMNGDTLPDRAERVDRRLLRLRQDGGPVPASALLAAGGHRPGRTPYRPTRRNELRHRPAASHRWQLRTSSWRPRPAHDENLAIPVRGRLQAFRAKDSLCFLARL